MKELIEEVRRRVPIIQKDYEGLSFRLRAMERALDVISLPVGEEVLNTYQKRIEQIAQEHFALWAEQLRFERSVRSSWHHRWLGFYQRELESLGSITAYRLNFTIDYSFATQKLKALKQVNSEVILQEK